MDDRVSPQALEHYRKQGWLLLPVRLDATLCAPATAAARALAAQRPWQEQLSGIHNPFGRHAAVNDAWKFLDIAESTAVLDVVDAALGPDIVLWDSELYIDFRAFAFDEAQYWPVDPLAGLVAAVALDSGTFLLADITRLAESTAPLPLDGSLQYVLRYMPATSRFNRDPGFPPTRRATEARPLVNYMTRPLWLLRGEDRAGNDFSTGFVIPAPRWAHTPAHS